MKIPRLFFCPFLSLFLVLLIFHEFYNLKYLERTSTLDVASSSSLGHHQRPSNIPTTHRKALASTFDFAPFLNHRHHRGLPPDFHAQAGNEIDPRYGVEKRLVPTGPNPLHH
ncbi:CLAVATA3/ESR (CLE)-related protein 13 [Sesamum alatum]|uniref:CLAVATA3/ESR (CLE)-related protein 13 n=1 Tax=Sesamum alatum TaxID=300844 RepID=A0AAE1Y4J4_9LAMI|nr:CLAVATA3/ESR (CLE)-related protein 13 [Sesamum alatum]